MEVNLQKLKLFFQKKDEILVAYLFGSQARGKTTPLSDVDIGLLVDIKKIRKKKFRYGYEAYLLSELGSFSPVETIDLVILNEAPLLLRHRCMREGKIIYAKDRKFHVQFKVRTLLEYLDTKPLREMVRRAFYGRK